MLEGQRLKLQKKADFCKQLNKYMPKYVATISSCPCEPGGWRVEGIAQEHQSHGIWIQSVNLFCRAGCAQTGIYLFYIFFEHTRKKDTFSLGGRCSSPL